MYTLTGNLYFLSTGMICAGLYATGYDFGTRILYVLCIVYKYVCMIYVL